MAKSKLQKTHRDYRQEQTDALISAIESGTAPWQTPFLPGTEGRRPFNFISGKAYRGGNALLLSIASQIEFGGDPRWMTFNQASERGMRIKPGSKGSIVEYWQFEKIEEVIGENGEKKREYVKLDSPFVRRSVVFNGQQIEGMPELAPVPKSEIERVEMAERILSSSGAVIKFDSPGKAFYKPVLDEIHSAPKDSYRSTEDYYSTLLHELGHWTGHTDRLNREAYGAALKGSVSKDVYAKEELRAEIASYFLAMDTGIPVTEEHLQNHAAYVASWLELLKKDKNEIYRAAKDAEQICGFLTRGLELERGTKISEVSESGIDGYSSKGEGSVGSKAGQIQEVLYRMEGVEESDYVKLEEVNFAKQVDAYLNGKMGKYDFFSVMRTPLVLQICSPEVKALPMLMTQSVMTKIIKKHNLSPDMIKQLPRNIDDPILVLKSATREDSIVAMLELQNHNGENIVVPVSLNVSQKDNSGKIIYFNDITSMYGKGNEITKTPNYRWFVDQASAPGRLLYLNQKKFSQWLSLPGLQLPGGQSTERLIESLVQNRNEVKGNAVRMKTEKDLAVARGTYAVHRYSPLSDIAAGTKDGSVEAMSVGDCRSREYKYYLDRRPAGPGAIPKGSARIDATDKGGRYGAVYYDRELSSKDVLDYELTPTLNVIEHLEDESHKKIDEVEKIMEKPLEDWSLADEEAVLKEVDRIQARDRILSHQLLVGLETSKTGDKGKVAEAFVAGDNARSPEQERAARYLSRLREAQDLYQKSKGVGNKTAAEIEKEGVVLIKNPHAQSLFVWMNGEGGIKMENEISTRKTVDLVAKDDITHYYDKRNKPILGRIVENDSYKVFMSETKSNDITTYHASFCVADKAKGDDGKFPGDARRYFVRVSSIKPIDLSEYRSGDKPIYISGQRYEMTSEKTGKVRDVVIARSISEAEHQADGIWRGVKPVVAQEDSLKNEYQTAAKEVLSGYVYQGKYSQFNKPITNKENIVVGYAQRFTLCAEKWEHNQPVIGEDGKRVYELMSVQMYTKKPIEYEKLLSYKDGEKNRITMKGAVHVYDYVNKENKLVKDNKEFEPSWIGSYEKAKDKGLENKELESEQEL